MADTTPQTIRTVYGSIGRSFTNDKGLSTAEVVRRIRMNQLGSGGPRPGRTYSQVALVYACVKAKADNQAIMPLMISTADDRVVESGPLAELADCPNPKMTGREFWRTTSAFLDLFGRVHWWLNLDTGGRPVEVVPLSPLQMRPRIDERTGELLGWKFRPVAMRGGRDEPLGLDEVHTIIDPDYEDPYNPFEGLSPRRAATLAIAQHWKADIANEASLDNGVEPSGAFVSPHGLTQDQRDLLHEDLAEKHSGVHNRRRFMVLTGGMDWKQMGASFAEMEFKELKQMTRVDICATFNVPPPVVGVYEDSNYAHADAAEKAFWVRTLLPRSSWLAEEWEIAVVRRFDADRSLAMADAETRALDDGQRCCYGLKRSRKAVRRSRRRFFAWFDSSDVPAVQAARWQQSEQAKTWIDKGVPLNDVIRAFDLPFPEREWGSTWYKPIGLVDVNEEFLPGGDDPDGAEVPDELSATGRSGEAEVRAIPEKTRARLWQMWRSSWAGLERAVFGKVRRHINELREQTLARLFEVLPKAEGRSFTADEQRDVIGQILFDVTFANEGLVAKVGPLVRDMYRLGGEQSMKEAADSKGEDKPDPFNIDDPEVARALRRRDVKITQMNRTLQRRLRETLAEGMEAAETSQQLAERLKSEFKLASGRARMIAFTETGSAVEEARSIGRRQAGVPLKSWLWSRKEKGRSSHHATEIETLANPIPDNEPFKIAGTGVSAPHPRATGRADHDINCGCTAISRFPGDSLKAAIDRLTERGFLTYEQMTGGER